MHGDRLSQDEKESFFRDGFVVIKQAIPKEISQKARDLISASLPKDERRLLVPAELATHPSVIGLFKDTCLADIMRNEMGPYPDVISCQVAVTPGYDKLGGSPGPHVDGSWGGVIPADPDEIDLDTGRPKDAAKYFGENDERRGTNDGQLWLDPDRRMSLGSFTAIVGVALNDQTEPGNGQFGVLRGMHEEVEAQFRMQRDAGGIIGPEGPGWPRIKISPEGRPFLNGLFETVRSKAKEAAEGTAPTENWPWPELTPVCLEQGDAVIALHACPHTPTPNLGPNPRMNCYFRIRRWREGNPHEGTRRLGHGVSDHLDRGYYGQFLEYPDDYDPWQTSTDKLCDHWSEWDGMQEVVAAAKP
jgi:hypothetical protein